MITMYVGDIHAACNDTEWLVAFKAQLGARFKIKDMGELSHLMGMHITPGMTACTISKEQSKNIMVKHSMTDCRPSSLPMDPGFMSGLSHIDSSLVTRVVKDAYHSLMGSPHYATICSRLDLFTVLTIFGSTQASPTEAHLHALKKLARSL
jgi:hypothetical protein